MRARREQLREILADLIEFESATAAISCTGGLGADVIVASWRAPPVRKKKERSGLLREAGLLLGRCALRMRGDDAGPAWLGLGWLG